MAVTNQAEALDVTWSTATGATGYKVQWKSGSQAYNADARQATATGTSHTISSLTAGTEYTVRVTATNAAGDGPVSDEKTGTPKAQPPAKVTGVTVTADTSALQMTWDAATNADGYKVQWKSARRRTAPAARIRSPGPAIR